MNNYSRKCEIHRRLSDEETPLHGASIGRQAEFYHVTLSSSYLIGDKYELIKYSPQVDLFVF